jgi:hypothetical protein
MLDTKNTLILEGVFILRWSCEQNIEALIIVHSAYVRILFNQKQSIIALIISTAILIAGGIYMHQGKCYKNQ